MNEECSNWKEVAQEIARVFSGHLLVNPEALAYLEERGIPRSFAEEHRVGFCPPRYRYDRFPLLKGRITVPIRDAYGDIVAFAGRKYEPMQEKALQALWGLYQERPSLAEKQVRMWQDAKWINERYPKRRHLFNFDKAKFEARELGYIIIVEGYMDAYVMEIMGLTNTAAICGTAFTDQHAALIYRYCKHIIWMMDGDKAGSDSALKHIPICQEYDLIPHIVALPEGKDPDEFVLPLDERKVRRLQKLLDRVTECEDPEFVFNLS